jgi:signal transduction histidine kinase
MSDQMILFYILASIFLMLGFAVAVVWFFTYAQKKITNTKLKQKELEVTFQKELLSNTVTIQENERDRISRELHDDIGSKLNIAMLNIHLLKKNISDADIDMSNINIIEESIQNCANRTRMISHELMPPVLQNFGFKFAVEELEASLNASGSIKINIQYYQNVMVKDSFKLLHIYRILQELISNTIKYAKASKVDISFIKDSEDILLKYEDNGLGFDMKTIKHGLGIGNIKTRCELLKGVMKIDTQTGKGFILEVKFPNHD